MYAQKLEIHQEKPFMRKRIDGKKNSWKKSKISSALDRSKCCSVSFKANAFPRLVVYFTARCLIKSNTANPVQMFIISS